MYTSRATWQGEGATSGCGRRMSAKSNMRWDNCVEGSGEKMELLEMREDLKRGLLACWEAMTMEDLDDVGGDNGDAGSGNLDVDDNDVDNADDFDDVDDVDDEFNDDGQYSMWNMENTDGRKER